PVKVAKAVITAFATFTGTVVSSLLSPQSNLYLNFLAALLASLTVTCLWLLLAGRKTSADKAGTRSRSKPK
ncbi:MAG TPA: hypothetical protein PLY72_14635, partial [Candidatus Obscuribacter sp.]|nr:hypothetical protein [Candidatus Obscuribacter sp.]